MFVYYSYFADRVPSRSGHRGQRAQLGRLDDELAAEDARLAGLESSSARSSPKSSRRALRRTLVLAAWRSNPTHGSRIWRSAQQPVRCGEAAARASAGDGEVSSRQQPMLRTSAGQAPWPVGGHVVARFGESRAGGVKWTACWWPPSAGSREGGISRPDHLRGLAAGPGPADHRRSRDGYMSLYGQNERLTRRWARR